MYKIPGTSLTPLTKRFYAACPLDRSEDGATKNIAHPRIHPQILRKNRKKRRDPARNFGVAKLNVTIIGFTDCDRARVPVLSSKTLPIVPISMVE
jgi:hypothetical protein